MRSLLLVLTTALLLAGCGDTVGELKEAAAGINSKANKAASAISIDVHSIRATEIEYRNQTFTINDVFKTILRDVQWSYDENANKQQLKVTGTWQDIGLFADQQYSDLLKQELQEEGQIVVLLTMNNGLIEESQTSVAMKLNGETVFKQEGSDVLQHLYATYANESK